MTKIKHLKTMSNPIVRKRDGATLTHCIQLALTTDEAIAVSELFEKSKSKETFGQFRPATNSLIRAAIEVIAERNIDENTLIERMSQWRTREKLAETRSKSEYDRAVHFLESGKTPPPPVKAAPVKEPAPRRVFVPDPPRKK